MKSRTWFLLSLMLFIAAAFFWKQAEERRVSTTKRSASVVTPGPTAHGVSAPVISPAVSNKKPLVDSQINPAETNSKALFPNRLSNSSKTVGQLARNNKAVLLRNALIDTTGGALKIPDHLRAKGDPGSYIVQARGPIDEVFRAELRAVKAEVISYVPNNAYLVRLPRGGAEKLSVNKSVQSLLRYEPYYKLDTELLDLAVKNEALSLDKYLRVTLFPGEVAAVTKALKSTASIISEDLKSSPFGPELIISTADLVALANMPQVQEIEPFYQREVLNDLTRVRMGVATNSLATTATYQGLSGANVLVNVNDTTIDVTHPDLAPRIFPWNGAATTDLIGHGTHVAGIIASSGANGVIPAGANVPGSVVGASLRGKATNANIFSMDIFAGFADSELQEIAARTNLFVFNRQSPLISNNSWGYGGRNYNSAAASYDMAVRDAIPGLTGSQPIIYVFAAGNSGGGDNNGEGGLPRTVTSPGTAKNVITVGALENFRNITNDIIRPNRSCVIGTNKEFLGFTDSSNQVAFFSSRGNVGVGVEGDFGRLKPDVVAPGTFVASTRSQQFDEANYYSTTNYDVRTFPNLVLDAGATGRFSIFIPDSPCAQGRALSFTIETRPNAGSPVPFPPLEIFVNNAQIPSSNPANLLGTNFVTVNQGDPKFFFGTVYYDIVNTNAIEVEYNLRTTVVSTNDYGNYFVELKKLNDSLGTNYIFESGTSMAAPAVSGMLALVQEFFEQKLTGAARRTNSPAMMKALLINTARSTGNYDLQRDRSLNIQGWGLPNLTRALPEMLATEPDPTKWPIQMFDQSTNSALATGESHVRNVTVASTNSPLRITLVWTDPPGNPTVGVKLVNDLDLVVKGVTTDPDTGAVVTNVYFGNNFGGSDFSDPIEVDTNGVINIDSVRDVVNNVENVFINGPLETTYEVSVVARRVNVNAVTGHTNGIVQDYALVISSGDLTTTSAITVTPATPTLVVNPTNFVTVLSNGIPLFNQRVGANSPLLGTNGSSLSNGATNQWNFYVLENPNNYQNVAFITFLPPNLSGTTNVSPNSRRNIEADIDMYVSTDSTLTNLNPTAIANCISMAGSSRVSRKRGGQELVVYTNASSSVYYVGIKAEDQQAAEYSFVGVASLNPFSQDDGNGNLIIPNQIAASGRIIPDGSPDAPGGSVPFLGIALASQPVKIARVVATNVVMTHERFGDLIGTLTHSGSDSYAVLNNHSFPVSAAFPTGQQSGTTPSFTYDDSDLVPASQRSDGPGSLTDFVGQEGIGVWQFTMEDNALNATGRVDQFSLFIERGLETNELSDGVGFTIAPFSIPPGQSRSLTFVVPLDATNMIISIAPKEGLIDTVVRRGLKSPTRTGPGGPYVDKGKVINPPGGNLTLGTSDVPPLKPGRYTLRFFNDNAFAVNLRGQVLFELDLTARSFQTFTSSGPVPILDDAVTNSLITVNRTGRVVDVEVGVRIDHPRVSDLVMHLVSPSGTRVLLAENRGGVSTNGYGVSSLMTNVVPATSNGDANPNTNIIATTQNSGLVNIDYEFFDLPDQIQVFYDGAIIYDTGLISGSGSLSIPYGPGVDTNIVIVVNGQGNPNSTTAWNYTATIFSGQIVYASFSENTNLALVPIKFAIPPFATNLPGSNIVNFIAPNGSFEADALGTYTPPSIVDGWTVASNSVAVEALPSVAYTGTNYLNLKGGFIRRTLPTVAGTLYNLKFAYKRAPGSSIGGARIGIGGVYTNEFIGTAGWIPYSHSFGGSAGGNLLELEGTLPDMLFDGFQLTAGGDPNYFVPEESLSTLIGERARGGWHLEVWDSRAGQPVPGGSLVSWQLHLTFTSSNATAVVLTNSVVTTNTVSGSQISYFIVDVPINATHATNILRSFGGPLNLLFNQNALPVGNARLGDYTLLSVVSADTNDVNTLTGPPYLQPGRRYYLGVQNANRSQTNQFTLRVDFDTTNNLVEVTPLTNGIPLSTNLPLNRTIHYYQYDVSSNATQVFFEILNPSADVDLVVRRSLLPSPSNYDFNSSNGGTNDELVNVDLGSVPPLTPGRYYIGVYGYFPTTNIDYTVRVTEFTSFAPVGAFFGSPTLTAGGVTMTAGTVPGKTYQLQSSIDLVTWSIVQTITATSNRTTFTDPTPPTQTARFYRLKRL